MEKDCKTLFCSRKRLLCLFRACPVCHLHLLMVCSLSGPQEHRSLEAQVVSLKYHLRYLWERRDCQPVICSDTHALTLFFSLWNIVSPSRSLCCWDNIWVYINHHPLCSGNVILVHGEYWEPIHGKLKVMMVYHFPGFLSNDASIYISLMINDPAAWKYQKYQNISLILIVNTWFWSVIFMVQIWFWLKCVWLNFWTCHHSLVWSPS